MAYTTQYVDEDRITNLLVTRLKTTDPVDVAWWEKTLEITDKEMVDFAEEKGVVESNIKLPLHNSISEWLVAYFSSRILEDMAMGTKRDDSLTIAEYDRYTIIADRMMKKELKLRNSITYEMITGTVNDPGDRSSGETLIFIG